MSYFDYMQEMLYPLKLYKADTGYSAEELRLHGEKLDDEEDTLDVILREAIISSAENTGLDAWEELFPYRPVCDTTEDRREALSALMRVDGTKFTLSAINDTIIGSGVRANATEADTPLKVYVDFGELKGIPNGFAEISQCIESIIPCHLDVEYVFLYTTWGELDDLGYTWGELDAMNLTWTGIEKI